MSDAFITKIKKAIIANKDSDFLFVSGFNQTKFSQFCVKQLERTFKNIMLTLVKKEVTEGKLISQDMFK